jgi:hypothetical protein
MRHCSYNELTKDYIRIFILHCDIRKITYVYIVIFSYHGQNRPNQHHVLSIVIKDFITIEIYQISYLVY